MPRRLAGTDFRKAIVSNPFSRPDQAAEFEGLLREGVRLALAAEDFVAALDQYRKLMRERAPGFAALIPPEGERAIAFAMFRELWNRVPRPERGWTRLVLPKPERNAACPCGSGAKYKQCCGPLANAAPFGPTDEFSVLSYVLETIPEAKFPALPFRKLNPEEVAHAAHEWKESGRAEAARQLLEALLTHGGKLDARHEAAFDELCDLYLDAGHEDRRLALVERLMRAEDRLLRAAALQRRATMHADAGEHARSWEVFKEAQRLDPDHPSLAHLELVLLANQNRYDEAQTRAAFWARRLVKLGYAGEPIVELMEDVARNPEVLREMMMAHGGAMEAGEASPEDVDRLEKIIENLPAPSCHYRLSPQAGSAGPLEPSAELAAVEQGWDEAYWQGGDDRDPWEDTGWIDWLGAHPLAWQSFVVIEAVVDIFENALFPDDDEDRLDWMQETLLDHAMALLRLTLAEQHAEGCTLDWGWHENRPALGLLMLLIEIARDTGEELPLLEWLLALNPNDNGGHRQRLAHLYCEYGRPGDALALCERYPNDDLPGTLYGRVLALYLLDRRGDAVAALAHASKRLPKVLKTLVAARPQAPTMRQGMVEHGGDDEAWLYRGDFLETWEKCEALDWLKEVAGKKS
jgi:tetratricopeptide (TPR) repeat protein